MTQRAATVNVGGKEGEICIIGSKESASGFDSLVSHVLL